MLIAFYSQKSFLLQFVQYSPYRSMVQVNCLDVNEICILCRLQYNEPWGAGGLEVNLGFTYFQENPVNYMQILCALNLSATT
jgi:hypothetical protein